MEQDSIVLGAVLRDLELTETAMSGARLQAAAGTNPERLLAEAIERTERARAVLLSLLEDAAEPSPSGDDEVLWADRPAQPATRGRSSAKAEPRSKR